MSPELSGSAGTMWLACGGLLLLAAIAVSVRVAAEHERVVVTRWGRVVRIGGPGLVLRWPLLERSTTVSLRATRFELGVSTCTADGASVHVRATGRAQVTDPVRSVVAAPDAVSAAISQTEDRLAHDVSHVELTELPAARARLESSVSRDVSALSTDWGVQVDAIELVDVEVRLTQDLADRISTGDAPSAAQPVAGG